MTSENENNDKKQEHQHIFGTHEFVMTNQINEGGKSEFVGGGYKVESFLLNNGMSPMTTINNVSKNQQQDDDNQQKGGKKVSSPFENLAVPAGLFFINQRATKKSDNYDNDKKRKDNFNHYKPHETASDDLMDKLFSLVEVDKKRKRKTKKHLGNKAPNKKTRGKRTL